MGLNHHGSECRGLSDLRAGPHHPGMEFIARLEAKAARHQTEVDGVRVSWRRFGAGDPVVLLHGGHGCWLHWVRNIEALAESRSVWVPDMPGYGESDRPASGAMESLVLAMQASLRALPGCDRPIDLVGFSFGGLVAAHLASGMLPVARLALLGPAGHGGPRRPRGALLAWRHAAEDATALAALMRENLGLQMLHRPEAIDALAVAVHTRACLGTRFRSRDISRAGGLPALLDACRAQSVMLIWGEHDITADPRHLAQSLGLRLPAREAVVLPEIGHWVQYEAAEAINQRLLAFLQED